MMEERIMRWLTFISEATFPVQITIRAAFPTFERPKSVVNAMELKAEFPIRDTSVTEKADTLDTYIHAC